MRSVSGFSSFLWALCVFISTLYTHLIHLVMWPGTSIMILTFLPCLSDDFALPLLYCSVECSVVKHLFFVQQSAIEPENRFYTFCRRIEPLLEYSIGSPRYRKFFSLSIHQQVLEKWPHPSLPTKHSILIIFSFITSIALEEKINSFLAGPNISVHSKNSFEDESWAAVCGVLGVSRS